MKRPGTYARACVHVCACTRVRATAFSARGSSHDNPMGVSHRFRGIGFDCCYLDPADEDTGDTPGVSQTYRVAFQPRLPRLAPRSIIPGREFATGSHPVRCSLPIRHLSAFPLISLFDSNVFFFTRV